MRRVIAEPGRLFGRVITATLREVNHGLPLREIKHGLTAQKS